MAKKKLTYEQAIERLEKIVCEMETGEAALEKSLALYKEGTELAAICGEYLSRAEAEVVIRTGGMESAFDLAKEAP